MTTEVDGVAAAQVQSIYDRWVRLEEAKADITEDLKELFAECKANGHNTKCMRVAFRRHRALETHAAEIEETDAIVEMILDALAAPRVGARRAREAA